MGVGAVSLEVSKAHASLALSASRLWVSSCSGACLPACSRIPCLDGPGRHLYNGKPALNEMLSFKRCRGHAASSQQQTRH